MRERPKRVRQSNQDHNPAPSTRGKRRSAVLACPYPPDVKDITEKFPPFEAWPEIDHQRRYYTLPTTDACYMPYPYPALINAPMERQMEEVIRVWPHLEPYKQQLIPKLLEYCETHYGTITPSYIYKAIDEALSEFDYHVKADHWEQQENYINIKGLFTVFSELHESRHLMSFQFDRPVTVSFKIITDEIFSLIVQQGHGSYTYNDFWVRFNELNDELMNCLADGLALEELRADFLALPYLHPKFRQKIINEVYPERKKDREIKIFHKLNALFGENWPFAWFFMLIAELQDPHDPLSFLEWHLDFLNEQKAFQWSDEQWGNWIESFSEKDEMLGDLLEAIAKVY
jgi:hypothetical protein